VITAERGPLLGRRLVIGREPECEEYYGRDGSPGAVPREPGA